MPQQGNVTVEGKSKYKIRGTTCAAMIVYTLSPVPNWTLRTEILAISI